MTPTSPQGGPAILPISRRRGLWAYRATGPERGGRCFQVPSRGAWTRQGGRSSWPWRTTCEGETIATMIPGLRTYSVSATARRPLIEFMTGALSEAGCRILHQSEPNHAPFVVTFETASGERMGLVAYAFLATRTPTKNRPVDERSFQIKYSSKDSYPENEHELWQDEMGMFTTMLLGIDPVRGFCVSADPMIHSPTKFFIRVEFKDEQATEILKRGWYPWERAKKNAMNHSHRFETLVGARRGGFLDLVRFERAVRGTDPGDRYEIAARHGALPTSFVDRAEEPSILQAASSHPLVKQFALSPDEILDLISGARRLKMAVRGWVAEEHLRATLALAPGVTECERLDFEGGPDLKVAWRGGPPLFLECKNVGRARDKQGNARIDFQRTRAAKGDPCSRYYPATDFDIVAACLHGVTDTWEFRYILPPELAPHKICEGRISNNVRVDGRWTAETDEIFRLAYASKGVAI